MCIFRKNISIKEEVVTLILPKIHKEARNETRGAKEFVFGCRISGVLHVPLSYFIEPSMCSELTLDDVKNRLNHSLSKARQVDQDVTPLRLSRHLDLGCRVECSSPSTACITLGRVKRAKGGNTEQYIFHGPAIMVYDMPESTIIIGTHLENKLRGAFVRYKSGRDYVWLGRYEQNAPEESQIDIRLLDGLFQNRIHTESVSIELNRNNQTSVERISFAIFASMMRGSREKYGVFRQLCDFNRSE